MSRKKTDNFKIDLDDPDAIDAAYKLHRARKMSNDADLKGEQKEIERLKKEKLKGALIPLKEAEEIFSVVGSRTKSRMNRLLSHLPQKLEGLTATQMVEVLRESFYNIHSDLFSEFSVKEVDPDSIVLLKDDGEEEGGKGK